MIGSQSIFSDFYQILDRRYFKPRSLNIFNDDLSFFFQFLKKYSLLFHLQKYLKKFDTRIFPPSISLSYFFFILDMAHHIDWDKGKRVDVFSLPQRRSDFNGLLIFRQKYDQ